VGLTPSAPGPWTPVLAGALLASALSVAAAGWAAAEVAAPSLPAQDDAVELQDLVASLEDPALPSDQVPPLLQAGFDRFLVEMERKNGPGAVGLARALHGRADAVWSAFCYEGALRRSATADPASESALAAYAEADTVLGRLQRAEGIGAGDRLAIVQRRAILAAGFADRAGERTHLGRALAEGGIDGAQILGLAALVDGDQALSSRLFGLLLDRGEPLEACPWAIRGHALSSLARLRGRP